MNKLEEFKRREFEDHRIQLRYFSYRTIRNIYGKKTGTETFEHFSTNKGKIKDNEWYDFARHLIEKYGEEDIFQYIKEQRKKMPWYKNEPKSQREMRMLDIHIGRYFEKWDEFQDFLNSRISNTKFDKLYEYMKSNFDMENIDIEVVENGIYAKDDEGNRIIFFYYDDLNEVKLKFCE